MAVNKLFITLPIILAARKIDPEDMEIVMKLRVAYFTFHAIIIVLMGYIYAQAMKFKKNSKHVDKKILIVVPPQVRYVGKEMQCHAVIAFIFTIVVVAVVYILISFLIREQFLVFDEKMLAGEEDHKKYKEVKYGEHIVSLAKQMISSSLFGMVFTVGLHFYKGMTTGMAINIIMGPLNMYENPLFKLFVFGMTPDDRVFEEKISRSELEGSDKIVDEEGKVIYEAKALKAVKNGTFEEVMLDTWDGSEAVDISTLMSKLDSKTINDTTKENKWTPLMIVSGLKCRGDASAIRQMKELGADVLIKDKEGWTALHWACFHGSISAAKVLCADFDIISNGVHLVKDKDGKSPLDLAIAEKNDEVAKIVEDAIAAGESKKNK